MAQTPGVPADYEVPEELKRTRGWHNIVLGSATAPLLVRWSVWYPPGSDRGGNRGTIYEAYAL